MYTYKIIKIGRKWIDGEEDTKGYKAQIEINAVSKDWAVGQTVKFEGKFERQMSAYGSKVVIFPTTQEKMKYEEEQKKIEKWLGYVEKNTDYIYKRGIEELRCLKLSKEQQERLDKAVAIAAHNSEISSAKDKVSSYLRYIEDSANKGKYYDNGYSIVRENIKILKNNNIDTIKYETKLEELKGLCERREKEIEEEYTKKYFKVDSYKDEYEIGKIIKANDGTYGKVVKIWKYWLDDMELDVINDTMDPCWVYNAKCDKTIITDDDIAAYEKAEEEQKRKNEEERQYRAAKKEFQETAWKLMRYIDETGICPPVGNKLAYPKGVTIYDTFDFGGSGDQIIIVGNVIWRLMKYCMNGDDWSHQNMGSSIATYREIDDKCKEHIAAIEEYRAKFGDPINWSLALVDCLSNLY